MTAPPTTRLYLEEPSRKTALATVTGHAAGGFLLDRSLYHASDPRYHHPQPCDRGHVLAEGNKLKVHKVALDRGRLVHRTHGPLPAVGAKAQLHLDADRRALHTRAHALAHLLVAALAEARADLLAPPEVVGGGEVRLAAKLRDAPAAAWPKIEARVRQMVEARRVVDVSWMTRDELVRHVTPQGYALSAIAPEEPTLRVVRIGECILPCDAPTVERSSDVGGWRLAPPVPAREGVRLRARVDP